MLISFLKKFDEQGYWGYGWTPNSISFLLEIAAVLELGCLFGALGAGVLADKISRRSSITSACGTTLLGKKECRC